MHQDFDSMTDEDIALLAQQGDADASEYLLNKYKNFVRSKARSYFLVGADHEDIVQEGMIGLFKAFRDFRPDKLASFHAFAEICVTRQIITAIKTATRQKHIPLNSYVSLNKPIYEEESDRTLLDVITEGRSADPEELLIGRESYVSIESRIDERFPRWNAAFWRRIWTARAIRKSRRCSAAMSRASTTRSSGSSTSWKS